MLRANRHIGFGAVRSAELLAWNTTHRTGPLTTFTFDERPIGPANADCLVVATIMAGDGAAGRSLLSVTIGGVAATLINATNGGSNSLLSSLAYAVVPTGPTADVVATFSGSMGGCFCGVAAITGLKARSAIHSDTDGGSGTTRTVSLNKYARGFSIACGTHTINAATTAWSGLTERHDETFGDNYTVAYDFTGANELAATVSATWGTSDSCSLAAASFI